jgi:hypothetical protein
MARLTFFTTAMQQLLQRFHLAHAWNQVPDPKKQSIIGSGRSRTLTDTKGTEMPAIVTASQLRQPFLGVSVSLYSDAQLGFIY